jgi:hypothetical protein
MPILDRDSWRFGAKAGVNPGKPGMKEGSTLEDESAKNDSSGTVIAKRHPKQV